jgi:enoyl-CoA hydratase/carnithine racemase
MPDCLLIGRARGVTTLTLNRPSRLNALDLLLRDTLADALREAASDAATRVVVLTGAGERAFCAGQDLAESGGVSEAQAQAWIGSWDRMFQALLAMPKPVIAALNGVTAGGGFELAMHCDLRIASAHARFIMAEIDVGLPAMTGSDWLAAHVFASRMLEIVLTGRPVPADEAARIGLVHRVTAPQALHAATVELAGALASKPAHAMHANVRRLRDVRARQIERTALMAQMRRYQAEAMASGEPQRLMQGFLAGRAARGTDRQRQENRT